MAGVASGEQRAAQCAPPAEGEAVTGITVVELAGRIRESHGRTRTLLSDFAAAGLAEHDEDGRWRLTARGMEYGAAASDLRPLGHDDPGEIKQLKRGNDSDRVRTAHRARRVGE